MVAFAKTSRFSSSLESYQRVRMYQELNGPIDVWFMHAEARVWLSVDLMIR